MYDGDADAVGVRLEVRRVIRASSERLARHLDRRRIRDEPGASTCERVTVRFEPRDSATEVIVLHERIADDATRNRHAHGWAGCLDGLEAFVAQF